MIIVLFIAACLVLQHIKDSYRGKKKPDVSLRFEDMHMVFDCGCDVAIDDRTGERRVERACRAHGGFADELIHPRKFGRKRLDPGEQVRDASCGCFIGRDVHGKDRVLSPCAAHKAMMGARRI